MSPRSRRKCGPSHRPAFPAERPVTLRARVVCLVPPGNNDFLLHWLFFFTRSETWALLIIFLYTNVFSPVDLMADFFVVRWTFWLHCDFFYSITFSPIYANSSFFYEFQYLTTRSHFLTSFENSIMPGFPPFCSWSVLGRVASQVMLSMHPLACRAPPRFAIGLAFQGPWPIPRSTFDGSDADESFAMRSFKYSEMPVSDSLKGLTFGGSASSHPQTNMPQM